MAKRFDFEYIIIGGGAAGLTAARQLASAKHKVAVIEQNSLGGTAVNDRDVPGKALSHFSNLYAEAIAGSRFGMSSTNLRYNYPTVLHWKERAISRAKPDKKALEEMGVTFIRGKAHFVGPYDISVGGQEKTLSASKFLITTGAELMTDGISGLDTVPYYTPATALDIPRPPKAVLVVGGGASGVEIAEYYAELGAKVVIAEMSARLLPKEDEEVGQVMAQYLAKRLGIKTLTDTRVTAIEKDKISTRVVFMRGGQEKTVRVETVVVATGSKPAVDLGLNNARVNFDKNGITVDKTLQTSARNVFAAGDVLGGESSTEKAVYSAEIAVMNMIGRSKAYADYSGFMRIVDTHPQVATVGFSEDDLVKRSRKYRKVVVPLSEVISSTTSDFRIGFLKVLVDHQGKILGATMLGPSAAECLQEFAMAIRHGLTLVQIASTPHPAGEWTAIVKVATKKLANSK